jgi:UDP-N-acetylglucosamine 1-carboxyvinyltransferase
VEGVTALDPIDYYAMNDRLDAGLFMMAAGIAGGKISIIGVAPGDLRILIEKMMQMGIDIGINGHVLDVSSPGRHLKPVNVLTCPYPWIRHGFSAGHHGPLLHRRRPELHPRTHFRQAIQPGGRTEKTGGVHRPGRRGRPGHRQRPTTFKGADTNPDNIRAASCILLAGLACPEKTIIRDVYQIGRGHFDIENRFQQIGARVTRKTAMTGEIHRGGFFLPGRSPLDFHGPHTLR